MGWTSHFCWLVSNSFHFCYFLLAETCKFLSDVFDPFIEVQFCILIALFSFIEPMIALFSLIFASPKFQTFDIYFTVWIEWLKTISTHNKILDCIALLFPWRFLNLNVIGVSLYFKAGKKIGGSLFCAFVTIFASETLYQCFVLSYVGKIHLRWWVHMVSA